MKFNKLTAIMIAIFYALFTFSCLDEGDNTLLLPVPDTQEQPEVNTVTGTSGSYTQVSRNGFLLTVPIQSIAETSGGNEGRLVFSLETTEDLPRPLPSGLSKIGDVAKIEPFNFNFKTPLTLALPIGSGQDVENVSVYRFNESTNTWERIPVSGFGDRTVIVSIFSLGYFVVVKNTETVENTLGGIRFVHPSTQKKYFYSLTLSDYSGSASGYSLNGANAYTIPLGNGTPDVATYIPYIPRGSYYVYVTREERSTISSELTSIEYYSTYIRLNVEGVLNRQSGQAINNWNAYSGWTNLVLGSGSWISGRPSIWVAPTQTYGTGKFQATLTWVNATSSTVDYDLHLYGPNALHVYYSNKTQGCFELDRDWLTGIGNAIENIYSINDQFPAGEYTIKVHLFGGTTGKEFNCRVLYEGRVVQSIRNSLSQSKAFYDIYTFTVK
jgi:hypothetical protein